LANPWDMKWDVEDDKKKSAPAPKGKAVNPWDMEWDVPAESAKSEEKPAEAKPVEKPVLAPMGVPVQEENPLPPTPEPLKKTYEGSILPFSTFADGSRHFDSDAGIMGAVKRAIMLPGEAMEGKVDPLSEEGLGRSLEFAGTFGFGQTQFPKLSGQALEAAAAGPGRFGRAVVGKADDPALVRQRVQDLRDLGAEPTAGMVSGSERAALKENALLPTSSGKVIQSRIDDAFTKQGGEFDRLTDGAANSKSELGQALVDQANAVRDAHKAKSSSLYDEVGKLTADTPARGDASRKALADLHERRENLSNSAKLTEGPQVNKAIKHAEAIVKDIDNGTNFSTLKQARTSLGETLANPNIDPVLKGHLQTLRSALSDDMAATANASSPEAMQAWKTANEYYKTYKDPETGFGKGSDASLLLNKDADTAYNFVMTRAKDGGQRLNNLKGQIVHENGQQHWDQLGKTVLRRMGTDANGDFSGTALLKGYEKMAPEAKDTLFGASGSEYRDGVERLVRVSKTLKDYGKYANHSNTQNHSSVLQEMNPFDRNTLLGAALAGPKGFAIAVGGKVANAAYRGYQSKLLTSPETVNWLADIPKAQMQKGGLPAHVSKLRTIAQTTNDASLRTAINDYFNAIGYEGQNSKND